MSRSPRNASNPRSLFVAISLAFCLTALLISEFLPEGLVASSGMLLANLAVLASASIAAYRAFSLKTLSGFCKGIVFVSFALTYPLSGVVHLLRPISEYRGFFDLISDIFSHPRLIVYSTLLSALALCALWLGMNRGGSPAGIQVSIRYYFPALLLILGFLFFLSGAMANVALFGSIEAVFRGMTTVDRSSDIAGGSARYYFISRWFAWGSASAGDLCPFTIEESETMENWRRNSDPRSSSACQYLLERRTQRRINGGAPDGSHGFSTASGGF